jgi:hypothetical protein
MSSTGADKVGLDFLMAGLGVFSTFFLAVGGDLTVFMAEL